MDRNSQYRHDASARVADCIEGTTDDYQDKLPSEWAEETRILPRSTTPHPGPMSFDAVPYWREVVNNFDPNSPIRFVAAQKGAQVAASVSILENIIGYMIDYIRTQPVLFFTADKGLADLRCSVNIVPMIQNSGLGHLIQSNDDMRKSKKGLTDDKIEWLGGGYLIPLGAVNENKQRSLSAPILLRDEISGWPLIVGKKDDPLKLTETRTNSYETSRKVLDLSTPNETGTDAISKRFKMGDQRYWNIPCKHCHKLQVLEFRGETEDGEMYGLKWELNADGAVVAGSVHYSCKFCFGKMTNNDKLTIFQKGKWIPTCVPVNEFFRSYHLSALYAPYFARTWESIAMAWVEAWDDVEDVVKDAAALKVFYNNDLGEPYQVKTEKLEEYQVSPHVRHEYKKGELPGNHPELYAGGKIGIITMAVDVHKRFLAVSMFAWAPSHDHRGYAAYTIDYFNIEGNCESAVNEPWIKLEDIIENQRYQHDGREYQIIVTLIDASYMPDTVYSFCANYDLGVFPLRGRQKGIKGAKYSEFDVRENATGTRYVAATVDIYKDRWAANLKRSWSGQGPMPRNNWSAPRNITAKAIKEMAVEYIKEKRDPLTERLLGTYWFRPRGQKQELWDLMMYNTVALEMVAMEVSETHLGLDYLSWPDFWKEAETGLYFINI